MELAFARGTSLNELLRHNLRHVLSSHAGLITVGNDISQLFVSVALSYYAARSHRPRWIAFGIYTVSFIHMHLRRLRLMRCIAYYSRAVLSRRREMKSAVSTRPEERAGRRHNSPIGRFLIKLGSVRIVATLIHASCHRTLVVVCLAKRSILRIVKRRLRNALDIEWIVERATTFIWHDNKS